MANEIITILQSLFVHTETVEGTANGGFPSGTTDMILAKNVTRPTPRKFNERQFAQAMGTRNGKIGAIDAAPITFDTEIKGNGTTTVPEVSALLNTTFGALNTDTLASTATGGSSTVINTGSTAGLTVGNAILVETGAGTNVYEMAWCTAFSANVSITVAPALSFSPANTAKLKGTTTYTVQDTGHPSLSIYDYLTGGAGTSQVVQYLGARGNMKFSVKAAGDIPMAAWAFKAWNWVQATNGTRPTPTYDTSKPPNALSTIFKVAGTKTDILELEIDIGNVVTQGLSQNSTLGVYKNPVTNRKTTGKFRLHADSTSVAQFTGWTGNTQVTLAAQYGNTQFGTIGWYMPAAERTGVAYGDDKGLTSNDVTFNANITSGQDSYYFAVG